MKHYSEWCATCKTVYCTECKINCNCEPHIENCLCIYCKVKRVKQTRFFFAQKTTLIPRIVSQRCAKGKINLKYCRDCNIAKPRSEFYTYYRTNYGKRYGPYINTICKPCSKYKYARNSVDHNLYTKYYYAMRARVFLEYGNCCQCCGEDWIEYLQLDHVNGRKDIGHPRMLNGIPLWRWIIEHAFPNDIQLLCANCHVAKTKGLVCKHKLNS